MLPVLRSEDLARRSLPTGGRITVPNDRKFVITAVEGHHKWNYGDVRGLPLREVIAHGGSWVVEPGTTITSNAMQQVNSSRNRITMYLHGFWVYDVERYPKTEIDEMHSALEAKHDAAIVKMKEEHSKEIQAVKDAIGKASSDALSAAAIKKLTNLVRDGLFSDIPEELAKLIKDEVELILAARETP